MLIAWTNVVTEKTKTNKQPFVACNNLSRIVQIIIEHFLANRRNVLELLVDQGWLVGLVD